jgi:hypothetical protein
MANPRIAFTLVVVFLAGAAVGMLGMRYGLHEQLHPASAPDATVNAMLEHFRTELKLSPDQAEKLSVVLADYGHYYKSVEDQMRDMHLREQIEDLRSTGKNRIMEILNDDQRKQFEKMMPDLVPVPAQP